MKSLKLLLLFLVVVVMSGCVVRSLQPLFTEKDLVFKTELVGTWTQPDAKAEEYWQFEKGDETSYKLIYKGEDGTAEFDVHLVKLKNNFFLDFLPTGLKEGNDFYRFHFIESHSFARIWIEKDSFRMSVLNYDWFSKMIDNGKIKIAHEKVDDTIIVTAATKDLQKILIKYADDKEAFPEASAWNRKKE
ncbi:MAG: hypothetical protein A2Y62_18560 [Candidatus Fischerbacteria bacterium RBG_13_37_8]|uniref:Uncharacterized protein n=1 Tax=Candidatus Fischerbacteria bacterium RBG_13_37_8 TaxID=1817863 RepID=A0A1F5V4G5_9BACT|nr:MAG: hypothetical protein A2Y62_18560 [Candidatus Fischerbacteria bacterium RBG_13_37_8]